MSPDGGRRARTRARGGVHAGPTEPAGPRTAGGPGRGSGWAVDPSSDGAPRTGPPPRGLGTRWGALRRAPRLRWAALVLYYAALIVMLARMYGAAHHAPPPPFIYQGF